MTPRLQEAPQARRSKWPAISRSWHPSSSRRSLSAPWIANHFFSFRIDFRHRALPGVRRASRSGWETNIAPPGMDQIILRNQRSARCPPVSGWSFPCKYRGSDHRARRFAHRSVWRSRNLLLHASDADGAGISRPRCDIRWLLPTISGCPSSCCTRGENRAGLGSLRDRVGGARAFGPASDPATAG
jgi:hypothetical protein